MKLTNPFIGYVTRSYLQIKQDVLTKFQSKVPEITDHTETNPWVKGIAIWASITEMLGYYIDASAREVYLATSTQFSSVVKIARMFDYRIRGVIASTVDLTFFIEAPAGTDITIPAETIVRTGDNVEFRTVAQVVITAGETEVTVGAVQHTKVTNVLLGTSDGSENLTYELEAGIVDNSIVINVDGDIFQPVDTFAYESATNQTFVAGINEEKVMELKFGDDINGKIPASGKDIIAEYYTSLGALGKVAPGSITQIISAVTTPPGVTLRSTNIFAASGGSDAEGIVELKRKIPLSIRTLMRAVTRQDYIDIASLAPGVQKAGVVYDCGKTVDLYVVPISGGIASSNLLTGVVDFFEDKRMLTTKVRALTAGEINLKIIAEIRVLPNYVRSTIIANAKQNILNFLSADNQEVGGQIQIGDLYEVLENTTGVQFSDIIQVVAVPFPRPTSGESILNFNVETLEASVQNVVWTIKLISGTEYELFKGSGFIGVFLIGQEIIRDEVIFTVLPGAYELGDEWQFVTYPFNDAIELQEPSVPVTKIEFLDFTGSGGL